MEKLLLTAEEAGVVLGLSRRTVYSLLATGALRSVKIGGARRVPSAAVREYVEVLDAQARAGAA